MAEYRTIRMTFWTDPYVEGLGPEAKLLYIYLFTSPHTNNLGMLEISRRKIAFETGLTECQVNAGVRTFENDSKAMTDGQKIWLTRFIKHQTMTSPKLTQALRKMLPSVASEPIRCALCERYPHIFDGSDTNPASTDTLSIPYAQGTDGVGIHPGELEVGIGILKLEEEGKDITPPSPLSGGCASGCDDPVQDGQPEPKAEEQPAAPSQKPKREAKPKTYHPDFEAIWFSAHELMRRCGKKAAGASWEKARKDSDYPGQESVMRALKTYRAEQEAKVDPKVCHLSVWLNQGRWNTGQDVEAHEVQGRAQRNAEREAAQRREEEAEQRRKDADKAWAAAWDKLADDVKERWREYVIERNSMLAQAKEKGHTGLLDIMARSAWRKHKEDQIKAQRAA